MSVLRDLVRDLAERRLWPLAATPPAALLGVLVLGGGAAPAPTPAPAPAPAVRPAPASASAELERLAARRDRARPAAEAPAPPVRDPFTGAAGGAPAPLPQDAGAPRRRATPRPSRAAGDIVKAAQRAAEANARAVTAAAAVRAPAPTPAPAPAPSPAAPVVARSVPRTAAIAATADVRLSEEGEVARARRGVPVLTPLPSVRRAVLVVRDLEPGVVEAVVRPGARVTGGRCLPRRGRCRVLRVAAGRTARVVLADGAVHRLRVLRVARRPGATATRSARCFARALGLTAPARVATAGALRWSAAAARCR